MCREIQYEIDDLLVDGDSAQLACDWLFIDDTISKAWLKYSRRPAGYYDGILQLLDTNHPKQSTASAPTMHAALHPSTHDSLEDKTLVCERLNEDGTTCGESSEFNKAAQLRFKQLGYKHLPKSCFKHRGQKPQQNAPRVYASDKFNAGEDCNDAAFHRCREFQAGICTFGDHCKLTNADPPTNTNAAMPDYMNLEDLASDDSDDTCTVYSW